MKMSESDRSALVLRERLKKNADNISIQKSARIAQKALDNNQASVDYFQNSSARPSSRGY